MNPRRLPLLLLTLLPLAAVRPADTAWRLVETMDDLTGASDRRLILRSENWNAVSSTATIVVVCGDRIASSEGRSLLFFAGQPLEPFGNELYAELRFDDQPRSIKAYLTIQDVGDARATRQVAFLGTDQSPYFSRPLLDQLIAAGKLSVTYRAYGEVRTVSFHPAGLREALPQLAGCHFGL